MKNLPTWAKVLIGFGTVGITATTIYYSAPHVKKWLAARNGKKPATTEQLRGIVTLLEKHFPTDMPPGWAGLVATANLTKEEADKALVVLAKEPSSWTDEEKKFVTDLKDRK